MYRPACLLMPMVMAKSLYSEIKSKGLCSLAIACGIKRLSSLLTIKTPLITKVTNNSKIGIIIFIVSVNGVDRY